MRVIANKILREFWEKYPDSEQQLKTSYKEEIKADWESPAEVVLVLLIPLLLFFTINFLVGRLIVSIFIRNLVKKDSF